MINILAGMLKLAWAPSNMKQALDELEYTVPAGSRVLNDVKKAYRKMSKKWHPDVCKGDPTECETKFKRVNNAWIFVQKHESGINTDSTGGGYGGYGGGRDPWEDWTRSRSRDTGRGTGRGTGSGSSAWQREYDTLKRKAEHLQRMLKLLYVMEHQAILKGIALDFALAEAKINKDNAKLKTAIVMVQAFLDKAHAMQDARRDKREQEHADEEADKAKVNRVLNKIKRKILALWKRVANLSYSQRNKVEAAGFTHDVYLRVEYASNYTYEAYKRKESLRIYTMCQDKLPAWTRLVERLEKGEVTKKQVVKVANVLVIIAGSVLAFSILYKLLEQTKAFKRLRIYFDELQRDGWAPGKPLDMKMKRRLVRQVYGFNKKELDILAKRAYRIKKAA